MPRLPIPGSDDGQWGDILNDFLTVAHNSDGTIDPSTIDQATDASDGVMSATDKIKLDGIASGATANATDAQLRDRSTHTGTQAASTISDFSEAVDDRVSSLLVAGDNVTLDYDDSGNTLTVSSSGLTMDDTDPTYLHHAPDIGSPYLLDLEFNSQNDDDASTAVAASGTATWNISRHGLHVTFEEQWNDSAAILWPCELAVGDAVETAFSVQLIDGNYWQAGVCVADGTSVSASIATSGIVCSGGKNIHMSAYGATINNINHNLASGAIAFYNSNGVFRVRVLRTNTNTWRAEWSLDGTVWTSFGQDFEGDVTMSPQSHVGMYVAGAYQMTSPSMCRFEYLRAYTV